MIWVVSAEAQNKSTLGGDFAAIAKQAGEARDAERLDDAAALYKKALALKPSWAEGWWSLGTIEYDRSNYSAAASAFRTLLPLASKDGNAHAMLGLCEFELADDASALRHLREATELGLADNPQFRIVVVYHYGVLLERTGKFQAAQGPLSSLCPDAAANRDVLTALGLSVLRVYPKSGPAEGTPVAAVVLRVGQAACHAWEKQFDLARKEYSELVAEYPEYPGIHYVYGKFLAEVNDSAASLQEFQREIQNNPKDLNSRLEIAATQYKVDSAAAIPYAEEAVRLSPRLPFAHYLLGLLYLDTDQYLKAIPELEAAQKGFPNEPKIYFALGSAYSRAGRKQDAEKARAAFERLQQQAKAEPKPGY